jgi:hypothetical protein
MTSVAPEPPVVTAKVPAIVHVLCGWPLVMVAFGGAIGGGLGGLAYGVNIAIYKSQMPLAVKILLNIFTGFAAVGIWLAIAILIGLVRSR